MNAVTESCFITKSATVISVEVQDYVARFHTFADKSAENILEMCKVVYDASKSLKKKDFATFCSEIRLHRKSAAISKFKTIGEKYSELSKYKDRLPSTWTTLYYLAQLSEQEIGDGIKLNLVHPMMKASEINKIAPGKIKSGSPRGANKLPDISQTQYEIAILGNPRMAPADYLKLRDELQTVCDKYDCTVILGT